LSTKPEQHNDADLRSLRCSLEGLSQIEIAHQLQEAIMMVDVLHQSRHIDKLITAFRTAVGNYGTLDKEATSHNGVFVVFRLA
jgi:RAB protein geranylgeranyltransferase component A